MARASMRPPEFTGGNPASWAFSRADGSARFNEAAGIHRRKLLGRYAEDSGSLCASMRPPEFTGGNRCPVDRSPPGF